MIRLLSVLAAVTLAAAASAQCTLSVSGSGTSTITFSFNGPANSPAALAIGDTQGSTTFTFGPLGSLTLGLEMPFVPAPLGMTDGSGNASLTINVPAGVPSADLFAQGVGITFTPVPPRPSLTFCTTSVEAFAIGS
jgi:hypothetical protein